MFHCRACLPWGTHLQNASGNVSSRHLLQQQHQATETTQGPGSLSVCVTRSMKVAPGTGFLGPIPSLAVSCCVFHRSSCVLALWLTAYILQAGCRANLLSAKCSQGKTSYHPAHPMFPMAVRPLFQSNQHHLKGSPCRSGISALQPGLLPRDLARVVSSGSHIKDNSGHSIT